MVTFHGKTKIGQGDLLGPDEWNLTATGAASFRPAKVRAKRFSTSVLTISWILKTQLAPQKYNKIGTSGADSLPKRLM
jgi:hypothetical protein